uniref:HTH CENPB-type domain-containing protein n=1 Tax=Globisporangium ultimum (strain ATCC 200006 / CBS 805.95 / DAOM BR144) TaxID=431595 RepID=K3W840_GLOUD
MNPEQLQTQGQQQQLPPSSQQPTNEEEILSLTLSECGDASAEDTPSADHDRDVDVDVDAHTAAMAHAQAQAQEAAAAVSHHSHFDGSMESNSVQSYFQHDHDVALAASVSNFSREFNELQKSVAGLDDRRLSDDIAAAKLETHPHSDGGGTFKSELKKRKGGANVSIDLQTKIRLIELAEEYQYDPKSSGRGKQEGGNSHVQASKEQMSGIRLAAQFGLNKSTVSRILKRKDEFKKAYYKDNISGCSKHINKKSKFEKLNRLVENWFDMTREKKVAVSDTLIRDVGKRFAEELGIEDFRGSNGWVRSLRNRKENQARNMSIEAMEREKIKKDAEAIERMRLVFPNGMKDMAGFFKDLSTFLEKDCGGIFGVNGGSGGDLNSHNGGHLGVTGLDAAVVAAAAGGASSYGEIEDELKEEDKVADEFLRKKMVESLRSWSHELMESELSRLKKRLKPRQVANL